MKMKNKMIAAALLGALALTGCGSSNSENKVQESVASTQETAAQTEEQIALNENADQEAGTSQLLSAEIAIGDDYFIENMDKIFIDLDEYEGKTLTYEGFIATVGEEEEGYAVVRNYELDHGDHSHTIHVGMDVLYDGTWPELDSWVKVTGIITRQNAGGEDYPALQVEEMIVMPERGQETVVN